MPSIKHYLLIKAQSEKVYTALSKTEGLCGWWTTEAKSDIHIGGIAEFIFGERYHNKMEITNLLDNTKVEWKCIEGDKEWIGTTFLFDLEEKDGIKFQHNNSISYYDEVITLLRNLDLGEDKMIILIDEFADTIENIIRDENDSNAIHFLETNREIRQHPKIQNKLQFIYAGSIGLENVAERINGTHLIIDLNPVLVPPLNREEVESLLDNIIYNTGVTFADGAFEYLLNVIEWWIPFYFHLILDQVPKILVADNSTVITKDDIDNAVKIALMQRIHFDHWFTRLRNAFKGSEFSFVKEVLNIISEEKKFSSTKIVDLSIKHKLEDSYNNLINTLKYDGYINNEDDPKTYRFNSPLLREWWNRNVAN